MKNILEREIVTENTYIRNYKKLSKNSYSVSLIYIGIFIYTKINIECRTSLLMRNKENERKN